MVTFIQDMEIVEKVSIITIMNYPQKKPWLVE